MSEARTKLQAFWEQVGARDIVALLGLVLVSVGAGMAYVPAAPIVAGVVLLVVAVFGVPKWS